MKYIKSILMSLLCVTLLASCAEWLDVNTDPENPSSESALYQNRLAHIEFYTNSGTQFGAWRTSMSMGDWTRYYNGGNYWYMSYWQAATGACTTPYQWWFVGAACNIEDMYTKAEKAGAYHYMGVAKVIRAYGFMLMTDLYGEMPYRDAVGENATPKYSTGDDIYVGVLKELDEGIELLGKSQDPSLPALSVGDWWGMGNIDKWQKFANLLKARYCAKLNKKTTGSYLQGQYDVETILAALEKGPKSISDDMVIYHTDNNSTTHDVLGWDEPVDYSPLYSVCGMNAGYMPTKMLVDNLTNFAGGSIEDPRADRIIPWAYDEGNKTSGKLDKYNLKWSGNWRRSAGVDMVSGNAPNLVGGPLRANYSADQGWYIPNAAAARVDDIIYVECTSTSKGYAADPDLLYRRNGTDASKESGSFYTRVSSPTYIGTYAEACFIKAEILFNKGDKSGAYTAYQNGVKASMDQMNISLKSWIAGDPNLADCPSFVPMTDEEINNYVKNGIGTAANLTLGKILTQKRIALHYSVEIWNDMRRYDFNPDYFLGWGIPAYHDVSASALKTIPAGKQFRRWMHCSHEYNYNKTNLQAIGQYVTGADMSRAMWNTADDVWTIPVWWDTTEPYTEVEEGFEDE